MPDPVLIVFCIVISIYFIILILVILGLSLLRKKQCKEFPFISVVIAARNEAERISKNLESLEQLDYPTNRYEIILVNDASGDNTAEIIDEYVQKHDNWKLISLQDKGSDWRGKKLALKTGIDQANGELIFTTDADCIVPKNWLRIMSCYFEKDTTMVLGHSPIQKGKGLLANILDFDNLFSAIVGAASCKLGYPITSVGRNLAYRKEDYERVGGFQSIKRYKSGDDVHMTERFRRSKTGDIDYCAHPKTFVKTRPPSTYKDIFNQQIRKNSKLLNKSLTSMLFSVLTLLVFLFMHLLPIFTLKYFSIWVSVIIIKFVLEFISLTLGAIKFRKPHLIIYFLPMQVYYPIHIIFFSFLGSMQLYQWKK
ncbi:MAG: glycosyltransferase [Caldithrix sp.]|nr:glycosyltransferase [Caldithrix sp.]